tara:strand:- start:38881 stop:39369 length:489 start_codon:yes stop_codon:yes gene_type:complete
VEDKNSAKERLALVDKVLDEYEEGLGLSLYATDFHDSSAQHYMGMSRQQMEKITVEECAEAALLLGGLSFHLQRSFNREVARVNWATSSIKTLISGRESQYSGSWDSQYNQAVKEDTYTTKLNQIKIYAQQRADRLTYLANSVKNLSDLFVNLQRAKINNHG